MLDLQIIQKIDEISLALREVLELPIEINDFTNFNQITFVELSKRIMKVFKSIEIVDNVDSDYSYMIKLDEQKTTKKQHNCGIEFEIHVGTDLSTEDRIDSLMHEMAHFILHRGNLRPNEVIGKFPGSTVQENEANCLSRAFLIPSNYFWKALTMFSNKDGSVAIDQMAKHFKVKESLIIERGRDLMIWN